MPLRVNAGLSKKTSRDFQSVGLSINLDVELDAGLLGRPDELQGQIENLYAQAKAALERESSRTVPPRPPPCTGDSIRTGGGAGECGACAAKSNGNGKAAHLCRDLPLTSNQRRALNVISQRRQIDLRSQARRLFGLEVDQLTVREASALIAHLDSLPRPGAASGDLEDAAADGGD